MAKKKPSATKARAKAEKKARTAQKVEKKEKKVGKSKLVDEEDDNQDLEGILDKVSSSFVYVCEDLFMDSMVVDEKGMGGSA